MKTTFTSSNGNLYTFLSVGNDVFMFVASNDTERTYKIRCTHKAGYSYKLNKKTIAADGGADGLVAYVKRCHINDINMLSVYSLANFIVACGTRLST